MGLKVPRCTSWFGHDFIHHHTHERVNDYFVVARHVSYCLRCGYERRALQAQFSPDLTWDPKKLEDPARYRYLLRLERRMKEKEAQRK